MKKILLTIVLCTIASVFYGQRIQAGLKTGANLSTLKNESGSNFDYYESKIGFRAGGHLTFKLKGNFKLGTELLYSLDGAKIKDSDNKVDFHRLSLPILFKYTLVKIINIEVGPEFNFLLGSKIKYQSAFNKDFDFIDYGASIGIELKPSEKFGIGIRNYFGLKYSSEIDYRWDEINSTTYGTEKSNVLSLTLNYYIK